MFEVMENYPETVGLFRQFGFSMIDNPIAQRIFARSVSLEQACRLKHVDFAAFEAALAELVGNSCGGPDSLIQLAAARCDRTLSTRVAIPTWIYLHDTSIHQLAPIVRASDTLLLFDGLIFFASTTPSS